MFRINTNNATIKQNKIKQNFEQSVQRFEELIYDVLTYELKAPRRSYEP